MPTSGTVTMRLSDTQRFLTPKAAPLSDFALLLRRLHIDGPLLVGLLLICGFGLFVLYSAVGESNRLLMNQVISCFLLSLLWKWFRMNCGWKA